MGSYSYDRDVYSSSSYDSWGASSYSATKFTRSTIDKDLDPKNKKIVSKSKNPIIIALDVTGSNINFARLVYDKLPMFYGEIEQKKYLEDFDKEIGIKYIKCIHVNDSKNELNSHKDRHENIGFGTIGFDNLYLLLFLLSQK